jgi:hypothetical protein
VSTNGFEDALCDRASGVWYGMIVYRAAGLDELEFAAQSIPIVLGHAVGVEDDLHVGRKRDRQIAYMGHNLALSRRLARRQGQEALPAYHRGEKATIVKKRNKPGEDPAERLSGAPEPAEPSVLAVGEPAGRASFGQAKGPCGSH